jgi:hypothetical protein
MKPHRIGLLAIALLAAPSQADAAEPTSNGGPETDAAPNSVGDEWTQKIHQGIKSEGVKSQAEIDREQAGLDAFVSNRSRMKFFAYGGLGAGVFTIGDAGSGIIISASGVMIAVGGGLRLGLSPLWQFQTRLSVEIAPMSCGLCVVPPTTAARLVVVDGQSGVTIVVPSVDATFRLAFGKTSPFYVGFGPKLGVVLASARTSSTYIPGSLYETTQSTTIGGVSDLLGGILELGALFGSREAIEIAVRTFLGGTTNKGTDGDRSASIGLMGGYAF